MSKYIKKLENILEGVKNYRFDDANVDEWKELTTSVLKGAIAREKANKEADELANSIWSRLESREKELPEPKFNENQEIVLEWLKEKYQMGGIELFTLLWRLHVNSEMKKFKERPVYVGFRNLSDKEQAQVLQAFATWALDQC